MKTKKIKNILVITLLLIMLLLIYIHLNKTYGFYIPCIFHKITGLYCPGCGITRCILSLLKGNIKAAFYYNQLFFLLLPFILFVLMYKIYLYIENRNDNLISKIPNYFWSIIILSLILFGILRNLEGFEYLRP